jgi:ribosome-binding factor A
VRGEIGHRLNLRYVPELHFYYDDTIAYAAHIQEVIEQLHKESPDKEPGE